MTVGASRFHAAHVGVRPPFVCLYDPMCGRICMDPTGQDRFTSIRDQ
ncbi:hypothetical protein SAMN06272781_4507 [Streptomyces sp. 1222.2]|uniref:Uncharacterized protein n=1 Tax=Streptomyces stelliscabiei TaxID=146820 RepID=A0A8I0P5W2_9ACTN|nr:hypothetical protein [Streptomyces stelliscabiei]SOD76657.1 hypothetical protein SAMN06272781_4507 [Streptomyces sp. 1222.2]